MRTWVQQARLHIRTCITAVRSIPQVVHVSLELIQKKCLSVCPTRVTLWSPTDRFFRNGYAHATRIRSKPSRRRSLWSKPHLIGCPVCGVIRVHFQHPNRGVGSRSSNRSSRGHRKNMHKPFNPPVLYRFMSQTAALYYCRVRHGHTLNPSRKHALATRSPLQNTLSPLPLVAP